MTKQTIKVYDPQWNRVEVEVTKVTHHIDCGYKYSRVHHIVPDGKGGTTFTYVQGHWGEATGGRL